MRSARFVSGLAPNRVYFVGYLGWALVAVGLWLAPPDWTPLGEASGRAATVLCLLSFVVGFAMRRNGAARRPKGDRTTASLSLMVASELGLLALGPSSFTPALLIVIAATIGANYPSRTAVLGLVALNLAFLAVLAARWRTAELGFTVFAYGCLEAFALLTTFERVRAEGIARELREVNAQLLATRELLAESARDGERLRVSRELHDVAGHRLTALALNLDLLGWDPLESTCRHASLSIL